MSNTSRPEDFDAYWQQVCHELEATPIAPEEEHLPIRSTEYCECYTVHFTGIGPYRLFGYLSIPHGDGTVPDPATWSSIPQRRGSAATGGRQRKTGTFPRFFNRWAWTAQCRQTVCRSISRHDDRGN